ncbi:MAG: hypothetical protein ACYC10_21830 [Allorhizobium sp.]
MTGGRDDPRLATGVLAATAWLMEREAESEAGLLKRAYVARLLRKGRAGELWRCDGALLARLLRRRARSGKLPKHGVVLIGIGEMIARSHAPEDEIESILGRLFRRAYPEAHRLRLLREALDLVRSTISPSRSLSPHVYEKPELSIMDWKQIAFADRWMQHPGPVGTFFGYGLGFVVRILLRNDPARLKWLVAEADERSVLPAVVGAVGEACWWNEEAARQALRSSVPLFACLGVAKLQDGGEDGKGLRASAINAALTDSKTSIEGRIHVSAFMLKEAVHAWHRQKDRPSDNQRRRAILEIDPHQALGGERYADNEIERLRAEVPALEGRRAAVMQALDDALQTAAQQDIDPKALWSVFEPSLVDTPEIRHRFAMAHPKGPMRQAALAESLVAFDRLVGVRQPETICGENFDSVRAEREFAFWAARSQVELSKANMRDAGHDAARRIMKVEAVLRNFVLQPFAANRFHERFQNALGRWSVVLQFALLVVLVDQEAPLARLRDEAVKSASSFLPVADRFAYDPRWGEAVAGLVADAVSTMNTTQVQKWIGDEGQPAFVRAQLVWSHPSIIDEDLALATSLIEQVAARKTGRAYSGRKASHLLEIVDRAAVTMMREKRSDLYVHLAIPYYNAMAQTDAPLARSITLETLLAALNGNFNARTKLLEDPVWGHSRISEMLRQIELD